MPAFLSSFTRHGIAPCCLSHPAMRAMHPDSIGLKRLCVSSANQTRTAPRTFAAGEPQAQRKREAAASQPTECTPAAAFSNSSPADLLIVAAASAVGVGLPVSDAAAAADEMAAYNNEEGSQNVRTIFGVGYVLLVAYFAIRLLTKRAARAKSERIAGSGSDSDTDAAVEAAAEQQRQQLAAQQEANATPITALIGAAQAMLFATILWTFTTGISGYFDAKELPNNYTARNITVTVKTVVEGLAYLLTFIFGANAVGLTALAAQLALFPGTLKQQDVPKAKDVNALPKISLTDDIYSIRRAFEEVQQAALKDSPSSGSGNGSKKS